MEDDGRGRLDEAAIRRGWAEDLSRMPGPEAHVDQVKAQLIQRSLLMDVLVDGARALAPYKGLRGRRRKEKK